MNDKTKRTVIWIGNAVVAVLCVLSIAGYFFAPFWQIRADYKLGAEDMTQFFSEAAEGVDFQKIMGEDDLTLNVSLDVEIPQLFSAFSSDANASAAALIGSNMDKLADIFQDLVKKTAKSVGRVFVADAVMYNISDYLISSNPAYADKSAEAIEKMLKDTAGIDSAYIAERVDKVIDENFENGGASLDKITEEFVGITEDVYGKLASSGGEFSDLVFSGETRNAIRNTVGEKLSVFSNENGEISADALLTGFFQQTPDSQKENTPEPVAYTAMRQTEDAGNEMKLEIKNYIMDRLPDEAARYIAYVMMVLCVLLILSSLAWLYILIKLIVKLAKHENPDIKLKAPIIFGWLPFLLLVCVPGIALAIFTGGAGLSPISMLPAGSIKLSFFSSGWIAFMAACILLAISIFYMVMRRIQVMESTPAVSEFAVCPAASIEEEAKAENAQATTNQLR